MKGQIMYILDFVSHMVPITTQLCFCSTKAAMDNTLANEPCSDKTLIIDNEI